MFESIDFDYIMKRMLERVPSDIDTREGSIVYDALAPAAAELSILYIQLDNVLNEAFADTASREYLERRAMERGIFPRRATSSVIKANFTPAYIDLIGQRFNLDDYNYTVTEQLSDGVYYLECETAGSVGNISSGSLIPIDYIDGLQTAEVTGIEVAGADEENTEDFRKRYFESFSEQAFGGNMADYKNKILDPNKIGAALGAVRITPAWIQDKGGNVRVTILDADCNKASLNLISTVQTALDPEVNQGLGYGLAPIGHVVTVDTADEVAINIQAALEYNSGYSWAEVESDVLATLDAYCKKLREQWGDVAYITVRRSDIEASLKNVTGIVDAAVTITNDIKGIEDNLELTPYQIPIGGTIDV